MNTKEQVLEILSQVRPDLDFDAEQELVTGGVLDSFDIVTLVGEFSDKFDISIRVENLLPENFDSAAAMAELIDKLIDED